MAIVGLVLVDFALFLSSHDQYKCVVRIEQNSVIIGSPGISPKNCGNSVFLLVFIGLMLLL